MHRRAVVILLAVGMTVLAPSAPGERQVQQRRIAGRPNLNGLWQALNTAHWDLEAHPARDLRQFDKLGAIAAVPPGPSFVMEGVIPYRAEARVQRDTNRRAWPQADPEAKCYMPGIPRATYMPFPFEIVQGEGDVILFAYQFADANRTVYMTAREDAPVDTWMGHSRGRWDRDTLIIEVTSNNDQTWFDRAGNHHGAGMRVTERYTLIDRDHLQYEAAIEDPATFTRPWTIRMPLYRVIEPNARLLEFKCVEFADKLLYGPLMKPELPNQ
jgi:hypothetical protein